MRIRVPPFLDFFVALLVVCAITTTWFLERSIPFALPAGRKDGGVALRADVVRTFALTLTRDGTIWLDGQRSDEPRIAEAVRVARANGDSVRAVIAADADVPHERVERMTELLHRTAPRRDEGAVRE